MDNTINNKLMIGLAGAFAAYLVWGLQPVFWKTLSGVDALVVIAHRYCWSAVFLIGFIALTGQFKSLQATTGECQVIFPQKLQKIF